MSIALIASVVLVSAARSEDAKPANGSPKPTAPLTPLVLDDSLQPSPQLSPEQVVQKQMSALSAAGPIETRIDHCYRFASPDNRKHTGPLERFAGMVQTPEYQAVLDAKHFLVGRATQQNNEAHLLVSAIDPTGQLTLFRFFLSKQSQAPYAGCWMTDAVIRVGTVAPPEESRQRAEHPSI